ncbi:MAG: ATP-binding protein [Rhodomicrobium sp.]
MLIAAAAAILIFLTGFSFWLTQRVLGDAQREDQLNRFSTELTEFMEMLRTAESSQRGYLITESPEYLEPYNQMSPQLLSLARELETKAPSRSAAQAAAAIIEPLSEKLEEMQQTIDFMKSGEKESAVARLKSGFGRRLTDEIESQVRKVQEDGRSAIQAEEAKTRFLEKIKTGIDGIGAALILTFSFLSLSLLLRSNAAIEEAQQALAKANFELEATVAQRTGALTRANQEIQRFAYIVSHDLRSPLVNIMGFTAELENLRDELFKGSESTEGKAIPAHFRNDFDESIGFIRSSIGRMDRLIAAILGISREGTRPLSKEHVDSQALVRGLLDGMEHQIRAKRVTVETSQLPAAMTDRMALEQIFANLIENAIKFLKPEGGGKVAVTGKISGNEIIYTVSDNGRGIDPKDHQRIFELFRRAGPQDVPGEGMGLAYVSALVRRLGGTIAVESELGRGSIFKLTLQRSMAHRDRREP